MKTKKLQLSELKIHSFVTTLDDETKKKALGGYISAKCHTEEGYCDTWGDCTYSEHIYCTYWVC